MLVCLGVSREFLGFSNCLVLLVKDFHENSEGFSLFGVVLSRVL